MLAIIGENIGKSIIFVLQFSVLYLKILMIGKSSNKSNIIILISLGIFLFSNKRTKNKA